MPMKKYLYVLLGVLVGMPLLYANSVYALVSYPPGALLQPGDVTTSHIRDATIVNADVSTSARIDALKINSGLPAGGILLANGTTIATSSALKFATSTSDLYVLGGRVHATSTNFGGFPQTWPTDDGTANYSLTTDGAGTLSWAQASPSFTAASYTAGEGINANDAVYVATSTGQFDAAANVVANATLSHTVSDDPGRLLVCTRDGDLTDTATGASFNGDAMTLVGKSVNSGQRYVYMWYLLDPDVGTHNAVFTGGTQFVQSCASYYHMANSNVFVASTTATGTGTDATITLTATAPNQILIATESLSSGTASAGAGTTQRTLPSTNNGGIYDLGGVTGTGSKTAHMTSSASNNWATVGALFQTVSDTPRVYRARATKNESTATFIGFAQSAIATSSAGNIIVSGVVSGFSTLLAGMPYYLGDSFGSTTPSAGTISRKVGISTASTTLLITNIW